MSLENDRMHGAHEAARVAATLGTLAVDAAVYRVRYDRVEEGVLEKVVRAAGSGEVEYVARFGVESSRQTGEHRWYVRRVDALRTLARDLERNVEQLRRRLAEDEARLAATQAEIDAAPAPELGPAAQVALDAALEAGWIRTPGWTGRHGVVALRWRVPGGEARVAAVSAAAVAAVLPPAAPKNCWDYGREVTYPLAEFASPGAWRELAARCAP